MARPLFDGGIEPSIAQHLVFVMPRALEPAEAGQGLPAGLQIIGPEGEDSTRGRIRSAARR